MIKKIKLLLLFFFLSSLIVGAHLALAADFGTNAVNNGLAGSLTSADPRFLVGRIIQIILSFLGVIALLVIMYAGFLWMTSDGDEEKITTAKDILRNAVIGLVIILSAWGIATFIISRLLGAIGGEGGVAPGGSARQLSSPGVGTIGSCTVESTYPANNQTDLPRNTSIMITFKEKLKLDSVDSVCVDNSGATCACDNAACNKINPAAIRLYKTDLGDACSDSCPSSNSNITDVLVSVASGSTTLVLIPASPLGSPTAQIPYTVKFTNKIKKLDGSSMFRNCSSDFVDWKFTVSSVFDLTPPIVSLGGVFPTPDNEKDANPTVAEVQAALGSITVQACPHIYSSAKVDLITSAVEGTSTATLDYHGLISKFSIAMIGTTTKAQLFDDSGASLGVADFNTSGQVIFPGYLTFNTTNHPAGGLWTIDISPEQAADNLVVNGQSYVFSTSSVNNKIKVPSACAAASSGGRLLSRVGTRSGAATVAPTILSSQAANIRDVLSGHPDIYVSSAGNQVNLTAKVAGLAGNDIALSTTNPESLVISPLAGGRDRKTVYTVKDKADKPMNSALQINFSEAVNPVAVSGSASEVAPNIVVVNANASSSANGAECTADQDCLSYKCADSGSGKVCVGDHLSGKFVVSNGYKTVEFISDKECGLNGCGEKIYCLPENSHLSVELKSANLKSCLDNNSCTAFAPFQTCSSTPLGYNTCQNSDGKNYPLASLSSSSGLDGIVDAALNSFDGDRSAFSDGPLSFYNENYASSSLSANKRDSYRWSFYINDQIMLTPPSLTSVTPIQGRSGVSLADPLEIKFSSLMLNSSLKTGSTLINNGSSTFEHKLINLRSSATSPLGYWLSNSNLDSNPLDGEPDMTVTKIFHSPFTEAVTYKAQVGSGVKDIYQNCYKPSLGPDCSATAEEPSCCFGSPTSSLGVDGNCR